MGVVIHHHMSIHSFMMGILWFSVFVLLGLLIRKLKFPIKFSVVPLLVLLILSVLRMFVAVVIPGSLVILSETLYPALIDLLRHEILPWRVFGFPVDVVGIFVCVWATGTVWLTSRYAYRYIGRFRPIMRWLDSYERDKYAESLLAEIIGPDKYFRVYRNGSFSTAVATAFKPYIILPEIEFSPDELRVILLHEWKHIQDKDYLSEIIVNLICFVFWWNPLVYVLRGNFRFAQELKCDQFAVSSKSDFRHLLSGIRLLDNAEKEKASKRMAYQTANATANALIGGDSELMDRLKTLALKDESRSKRIFANVCYLIVIFALFIASYSFTILPAFWIPTDVPVAEDFTDEYREYGEIFIAGENFIVDNSDGTFSLYIEGQFVMYVDDTRDVFNWLPIREREEN